MYTHSHRTCAHTKYSLTCQIISRRPPWKNHPLYRYPKRRGHALYPHDPNILHTPSSLRYLARHFIPVENTRAHACVCLKESDRHTQDHVYIDLEQSPGVGYHQFFPSLNQSIAFLFSLIWLERNWWASRWSGRKSASKITSETCAELGFSRLLHTARLTQQRLLPCYLPKPLPAA